MGLMSTRLGWVVCQLDILKRLNHVSDIRKALGELPRTLDETYEGNLCALPPENCLMARKTLHLLAQGQIHTLDALTDALAVDEENLYFDPENRPLDRHFPIEVCTCLVTHDTESDRIFLAHYTVEEYMLSARIKDGPAHLFHTTDEAIKCLSARCLMVYMIGGDYTSNVTGG